MCAGKDLPDQRNNHNDTEGFKWKAMVYQAFREGEGRLEEGGDPWSDLIPLDDLASTLNPISSSFRSLALASRNRQSVMSTIINVVARPCPSSSP